MILSESWSSRWGFLPSFVVLSLIAGSLQSRAAVFFVDGGTPIVDLNDGAHFSGYSDSNPRSPSSFSSNFLTQGNEQAISEAQPLSNIPISSFGGNAAFQFVFDAQEVRNTGSGGNSNRERIIITEITLSYLTAAQQADTIDDATQRLGLWSLDVDSQVNINDATRAEYVSTATPLSNGGDASLSIPFSVFPDAATSEDYIFLEVTLSDGDNGNDEWVYAAGFADGSPEQLVTFASDSSLSPILSIAALQVIPEPSSVGLLAFCLGIGLFRRSR